MKKISERKMETVFGGEWDKYKAAGFACGVTAALMFSPLIAFSLITAPVCGALTAHATLS